jgi:hypothetical protein
MVVAVLITSCHVSLNPNRKPDATHAMITLTASAKAPGLPAARAVHLEKCPNHDRDFVGRIPLSNS